MSKKTKMPRSLPKKIAGVKVPKKLRKFADTQIGGSLLAGLAFAAAAGAIANPQVRRIGADLRTRVTGAAAAAAFAVRDAAQGAAEELDNHAPRARNGGVRKASERASPH